MSLSLFCIKSWLFKPQNDLKCNSTSEFYHGIRAIVEQTCIELEKRGESEL